jgi:hypothetical protein
MGLDAHLPDVPNPLPTRGRRDLAEAPLQQGNRGAAQNNSVMNHRHIGQGDEVRRYRAVRDRLRELAVL